MTGYLICLISGIRTSNYILLYLYCQQTVLRELKPRLNCLIYWTKYCRDWPDIKFAWYPDIIWRTISVSWSDPERPNGFQVFLKIGSGYVFFLARIWSGYRSTTSGSTTLERTNLVPLKWLGWLCSISLVENYDRQIAREIIPCKGHTGYWNWR